MPLGDLENDSMAKILIIAQDQVQIENIQRELPSERSFRVETASSGFEAGILTESFQPDCVVIDFSIGHIEASQICMRLRSNESLNGVVLIGLQPSDSSAKPLSADVVDETFSKPFDAALLAERIRSWVGAKKELV